MTADGVFGFRNEPQFLATGAPDTAMDLNTVANYAGTVGNRQVGTTAQRNAASGNAVWEGLLWGDTSDGIEYKRRNGSWVRFSNRTASGFFVGATTAAGIVTVNHGLGSTPAAAIPGDTNGGAAAATRKVSVSALGASQIQFYVTNNGAALATNPVQFYWFATL